MADSNDEYPESKIKSVGPGGVYYLMSGEAPDVILARIDERTKNLQNDVQDIQRQLNSQYVTAEAFRNLADKVGLHQKIIFGLAGVMCMSVIAALLSLVVQTAGG